MKDASSQTAFTPHRQKLRAGLYIVATPIGNLGDITLRALTTLVSADLIACEDTRVSGKLLKHFGISTPTLSYHEHNASRQRPKILQIISEGKAVALISDAGTPLISDPGYKLVRDVQDAGGCVEALPGASSLLAALAVAGLPSDRFLFEGFLPVKEGAARKVLQSHAQLEATLIFFESAKRIADTLLLMNEVLGEREAAVCRELTKLYEETRRGPLAELAEHYAQSPEPRGEIVLVIGPPAEQALAPEAIDKRLRALLKEHSLKDTVALAAKELGAPHREVYARALALKEKK